MYFSGKRILSVLMIVLLSLNIFALPVKANDITEKKDVYNEVFIEHDSETGKDTYFTLQDAIESTKRELLIT